MSKQENDPFNQLQANLKNQPFTNLENFMNELRYNFMPTPDYTCSNCGKPLVFRWPKKIFKCTRCEVSYRLVVTTKVEEIKSRKRK